MSLWGKLVQTPQPAGRLKQPGRLVTLAMLAPIDFTRATVVVQLGGGMGSTTKRILKKLRRGAQLFVFEPQPYFARVLQHRFSHDSRVFILEASADHLAGELPPRGVQKIDYIISTLPMTLLARPVVENILGQAFSLLRPRGLFVQLHHTTLMRSRYQRVFRGVTTTVVPFSLPPSIIMACQK